LTPPTPPARRPFGNTGLTVPILGFGAGGVGDPSLSEQDTATLLNSVLDLGVGLIDTARSYGLSEERIGRHLVRRRADFVLSTKVGYSVPGFEDWTAGCVSAGVDLALSNLRTNVIDVVHLHSCPREVLERNGVAEALGRAVAAGKVRVAAYSGDGEALDFAVASGAFGSIQTSVNVVDQRSIDTALPRAQERGLGVVGKRALANAVWQAAGGPGGDEAITTYRRRWETLDLDFGPLPPDEAALRFAAYVPGVSSVLVATRSVEHLQANLAALARGPLPAEIQNAIRARFRERGGDWPGVV
jgi:aryl-alcohol dehydrogenase-like predicted oxidoreductase